jgi:hypothetical protein
MMYGQCGLICWGDPLPVNSSQERFMELNRRSKETVAGHAEGSEMIAQYRTQRHP